MKNFISRSSESDEPTYYSLVGLLIYVTNTMPDTVDAVSTVSRYMHEPSMLHYTTTKEFFNMSKKPRILTSNMFRKRKAT